jgi:hypothetical protein
MSFTSEMSCHYLAQQPPLVQPPELQVLQLDPQQPPQRCRWPKALAISGSEAAISVRANTAIFTYFIVRSSYSNRDKKVQPTTNQAKRAFRPSGGPSACSPPMTRLRSPGSR